MRGAVARRIRKEVYGGQLSPKVRQYYRHNITGTIIADQSRQVYQQRKKQYVQEKVWEAA
jgi:hypothetical protein